MKRIDNKNKFWGLQLFSKRRDDLLDTLVEQLKTGKKPLCIFTPNPEHVILSRVLPEFKQLLQQADILIPDGVGLVWASQLLSWKNPEIYQPLSQRIAGIDVVGDILSLTQDTPHRVMVVGGREYAAMPPQVVWQMGYQDVTAPTAAEERQVCRALDRLRPAVVLVAFGAPHQEKWIIDHRALLEKSGVKIAMVVGGAFDVLLGRVGRAPAWMRTVGLEWLYRLYREPWRWRRQLRLVSFAGLVLREMLA